MTSHEVKCLICGEICYGRLINHLRKVHNLTTSQYRSKFPNAHVLCRDEEISIRERLIERNKSDKQRRLISERNRDPEFQKKCQAGCTEETRRAQSENMKRVSNRLWSNPEYRRTKSQEMSQLMKSLRQDPDYVAKRSEIMKKTWENPENAAKMIAAPKNHPYGHQKEYFSKRFSRNYYCRSLGEYEFILTCESLPEVQDVVSGERLSIRYIDSQGQSRLYLPDFLVTTETGVFLVEVKYEGDDIHNYTNKVNSALDYCKLRGMTYCYVNRFSGIARIREQGFNSVAVTQRI